MKKRLPENWENMINFERCLWLSEHYGTNQIDACGDLVYDEEHMTDDVKKAYEETILAKRKAKTAGIMFD